MIDTAARDGAVRHTVIALVSGQELVEHNRPGQASLHVLHGRFVGAARRIRSRQAPATSGE